MNEKIISCISYFLSFILVVNFIYNQINNFKFSKINQFDFLAGILLFFLLFNIGKAIKQSLKLNSISFSIVMYLFSFFVFDILILFIYQQLSFKNTFLFVNFLWFLFFLLFKQEFKTITLVFFNYFILNIFSRRYASFFSVNNNLVGDVDAVFFDQAKNIYENSYFISVNNFIMEGYPQFVSYLQALFLQLPNFSSEYSFYSFTSHLIYYLTILFFLEINISKKNKIILVVLFTSLIGNSEWLQFLFTTSLMSEGVVSLFTAVLIVNLFELKLSSIVVNSLSFFNLGLLYLTKQFNSTIALIIIILFLFINRGRIAVLFGFFGIIINELAYLIIFPNISKEHHIRQIDLQDMIFDLILFRDLKFENILLILKNLWIDKPYVLIIIVFYLTFINAYLKTNQLNLKEGLIFLIVNLNFVMIFALYISAWQNMELESPIRYMLNMLHLTLVSIVIGFEKIKS